MRLLDGRAGDDAPVAPVPAMVGAAPARDLVRYRVPGLGLDQRTFAGPIGQIRPVEALADRMDGRHRKHPSGKMSGDPEAQPCLEPLWVLRADQDAGPGIDSRFQVKRQRLAG